ncbi:MAG: S9 family peptidase [Bacteroidales bacterium]|nr:S9 family peptidase [Bacteroidales bacterium]
MKTTFKTILLSLMTAVFCVGSSINSSAQSAPNEGAVQVTAGKKPLDHSVYDKWYGMGGYLLTKDGKYSVIYQNRAENDGHIEIINLTDNSIKVVDRGAKARLAQDNKHLLCMIRPFYKETKEAKLKKLKGDKMPKDTMCIVNLVTGNVQKFPFGKKMEVAKEGGNFVVFESRIMNDSLKRDGVFVYDLAKEAVVDTLMNLEAYTFNKMGTELYCLKKVVKEKAKKGTKGQSDESAAGLSFDQRKDNSGIYIYRPASQEVEVVIEGTAKSKFVRPNLSKDETILFFYANTDTTKKYEENVEIWTYKIGSNSPKKVIDNSIKGLRDGWNVSSFRAITMSDDNSKLFFGVGVPAPKKDTTNKEEMAQLDVWHYNDKYIQTQQQHTKNTESRRSYLSYVKLDSEGALDKSAFGGDREFIQLADLNYPIAKVTEEWNGDWAYAFTEEKYLISSQWDANPIYDMYVIDMKDGSSELIMEAKPFYNLNVSPEGKYIYWFDAVEQEWFTWNKETRQVKNISEKIPHPLYNELHDTPRMAPAYGNGGWRSGDKSFFVYDKYDVWELDPDGVREPQMLTQGMGREKGYTFKMIRLDQLQLPEGTPGIKKEPIGDKDNVYFTAFDNKSKGFGYYTRVFKGKKLQPMKELIMEPDFNLGYLHKAENADVITYAKGNFVESPNLWVTKDWFKTSTKLTNTNPQQKDYNWGTCESVYWTTADGKRDIEGLLYKPENFDPNKKYPMVVYFYEKSSQYKNTYRKPAVSRSTINITYFVSNGYLVFMPDVHYVTGHPGQSAMNCIVAGVKELIKRHSWVDADNIAIQGQSWGGYQVAYMVTQTDMFKCAGSGAPVANMTSAYGGIRWGSGVVRQFQYEHTQSRIGCTPWDKGGLELYIENSPLFFADKVNTPLLIMHNDKDEAVPWTQGIEYFTALRRLGKQVWMLQYNDETHNLSGYVNAYDYTIRLSQFMDHFLKGAPMPVWMKYGVPATHKGIETGLELVEE